MYDKSKKHQTTTQNNTQNFQQPQQNYNQNSPQYQNKNTQPSQKQYQHQQDFSQLTNIGLTVMEQGDNLVVVGEDIFSKKDTIRQNGFRWDGVNKVWYIPFREAT